MSHVDPVRVATAVGTMGMSETVRAGMNLASGGNPINAVTNAATFGGKDIASGVGGAMKSAVLPSFAALDKAPTAFDADAKLAAFNQATDRRRQAAAVSTVLTTPLGAQGAAPVVKRSLLGQ